MIGMIGLGNFGTALGNLIAGNGHPVLGWEYQQQVVDSINREHLNPRYLPGIGLEEELRATTELAEVLQGCNPIFLALPSAYIRTTLEPFGGIAPQERILVNTAKGIERSTGLTAAQLLATLFPQDQRVLLSGPSIANEFAGRQPTVVVLAGSNRSALMQVAALLENDYFRVRFSNDELGVELGGILKNAYVVALGMADARQMHGVNFRAAYLTLALEEMTRIGTALGARPETFAGLSGMGDLLATASSEDSHNRRFGRLLAGNLPIVEIERSMGLLPEGYNTIQTILSLAEQLQLQVPIAAGLWAVVEGRLDPESFMSTLVTQATGQAPHS